MAPAGPPPPAGVIFAPANVDLPFPPPVTRMHNIGAGEYVIGMRLAHRCHSTCALHKSGARAYLQSTIGKRPPPPSAPETDWQHSSSRLSIRIGSARRTSSPGRALLFCCVSNVFHAVTRQWAGRISTARNGRARGRKRRKEGCKTRMGAMQHRLCFRSPNRLYFQP